MQSYLTPLTVKNIIIFFKLNQENQELVLHGLENANFTKKFDQEISWENMRFESICVCLAGIKKKMNVSGISRISESVATPRKRLRIESFGEIENEAGATPKSRRLDPPPPLRSQMLRAAAAAPPPPGVAFFASKMEERLADLEIETRQEIKQMFKTFSTEIQKTFAAEKKLKNEMKSK